MERKGKPFFGGQPIGPDIRALNEAFPDLQAGVPVPYEAIGTVIGAHWPDGRFKRVLKAWRDSIEPTVYLTQCDGPNKRLLILAPKEALGHLHDEFGTAKRKVIKTARRARYVRPKDELTQAKADHFQQLTAKTAHEMEVVHRRLAVPKTPVLPSAATSE